MKTLGVCGCSWMSATINKDRSDLQNSEGKHFTEILAKRINYNYFTLARGACSNFSIRLQISELIKQKVDLILVGVSHTARIDFPITNKKFNIDNGIYNVCYDINTYPDQSCLNKNFFENNIISETMNNLFTREYNSQGPNIPFISREQINAIEKYYDYLYSDEIKSLQDMWIMHSALIELKSSNIPFVMIYQGILYNNLIPTDDKNIVFFGELCPWAWVSEDTTRRFHTTDESQENLAKLWYNYLLENNFIEI